jgi:hypothetical protein
MEQRLPPTVFYGSAIAAALGLTMGLALHGPWNNHPGGPQLWLSSAAAQALVDPDAAGSAYPDLDQPPDQTQLADLDSEDADPLPVVRLDPGRFDVVAPSAAGEAQRADKDTAPDDATAEPPPSAVD